MGKKERYETLKNLSNAYINDFLQNNEMQYFYISNSAIFISYNGEEFKLINESELLHQILTGISQNKTLLPWKQKIKTKIMKIIKEKNIFDTIPESHTIQNVINHITPLILQTKDEAKYFLTILGDNILKKNTDVYHILNNRGKNFITNLEENVYHYFKNSYHKYIFLNFHGMIMNIQNVELLISIDLLIIQIILENIYKIPYFRYFISSCSLFKRYGNSDEYILSKKETNPRFESVLYLSDHSILNIVNDFIKEKHDFVENQDVSMTFNEILYIWKLYLAQKNYQILFLSKLKTYVKKYFK